MFGQRYFRLLAVALLLAGFWCLGQQEGRSQLIGEGVWKTATAVAQTTTFDPANKGTQVVLSNSNKNMTMSSGGGLAGWELALITTSKTSGKFYLEYLVVAVTAGQEGEMLFGFALNNQNLNGYITASGDAGYVSGTSSSPGNVSGVVVGPANIPTYTVVANDVIAYALDFGAGKGWMSYNNTYVGSPGAGTNPSFTWTTGSPWFGVASVNFAADPLATMTLHTAVSTVKYSPPSGFSTWD